jgi:hypothetical protein
VYLLKRKDEVPKIIKEFFNLMQNQFGKNIKCFRSDNGGEFVNKDVKEYFSEKGIIHETSCVRTPQ